MLTDINFMNDYNLLQFKIAGQSLEETSTMTFLGWVAGKINGQVSNSPTLSELGAMIVHPPMGRLGIETKVDVIRKMEKLGIEIK